MVPYAFDLSEKLQEPVIFRTTTRINHSTGPVVLGEIKEPVPKGDFTKDPFNYVTVPAVSRKLHIKLLTNIEKAHKLSNKSTYNFTTGKGKLGIICNGVSYNYVVDGIMDMNILEKIRILRIGFSHPMPKPLITDFLKQCEKVLVVEEGEPYMEEAVKAIAQEEKLTLPIVGKREDLFSRLYEFNPELVKQCISKYFDIPYDPVKFPDLSDIPDIPQRPPTLCPGCSHRATFYAVKKAAEGMDAIYPTDIGCYTLGFLPPLMVGDFLICMGSSVGTSCGCCKTTDKKTVSLIVDSTLFHSGIPGLVNSVFNNHDFTLVILDNGTTAMTGHQPNPGVDMKEMNFDGYGQVSIENVVRALGVGHISVIRPFNLKKSIPAIREAINYGPINNNKAA